MINLPESPRRHASSLSVACSKADDHECLLGVSRQASLTDGPGVFVLNVRNREECQALPGQERAYAPADWSPDSRHCLAALAFGCQWGGNL
jgi:hypothetical protein